MRECSFENYKLNASGLRDEFAQEILITKTIYLPIANPIIKF